ncbi:MAG: hypothetical protein IPK19_40170 [Chloroflexi bacterium]|nr:hypothetical protein [Chloroflexota bacterium]
MLTVYPAAREVIEKTASHRDFLLETGGDLLQQHFEQVELRLYKDSLRVTEVEPLIAYILSGLAGAENLTVETVEPLRDEIRRRLAADGVIEIGKASGLFVCSGPKGR